MTATTESRTLTAAELNALIDSAEPIRAAYFEATEIHCGKCGGTGFIGAFRHVEGGMCFDCEGTGGHRTWTPDQQADAARRERRRRREQDRAAARRAEEAAQERAERDAKLNAWIAENPEAAHAVKALTGEFGVSLRESITEYGSLTERQAEAAIRAAERQAADRAADAAAEPVPGPGRHTITGEVLTLRWQDSAYGSTLKMLVRDDRGFKLWGSVPASLNTVDKGDRVTFTATVNPSDDDPVFGFFKRPTKAARA